MAELSSSPIILKEKEVLMKCRFMLISIYRSRANLYSISRCSKVLIAGFVDFKDEEIDEFVVCEEFMESFV
jgi:hypothetical protein